jgi:hypothetical protein
VGCVRRQESIPAQVTYCRTPRSAPLAASSTCGPTSPLTAITDTRRHRDRYTESTRVFLLSGHSPAAGLGRCFHPSSRHACAQSPSNHESFAWRADGFVLVIRPSFQGHRRLGLRCHPHCRHGPAVPVSVVLILAMAFLSTSMSSTHLQRHHPSGKGRIRCHWCYGFAAHPRHPSSPLRQSPYIQSGCAWTTVIAVLRTCALARRHRCAQGRRRGCDLGSLWPSGRYHSLVLELAPHRRRHIDRYTAIRRARRCLGTIRPSPVEMNERRRLSAPSRQLILTKAGCDRCHQEGHPQRTLQVRLPLPAGQCTYTTMSLGTMCSHVGFKKASSLGRQAIRATDVELTWSGTCMGAVGIGYQCEVGKVFPAEP